MSSASTDDRQGWQPAWRPVLTWAAMLAALALALFLVHRALTRFSADEIGAAVASIPAWRLALALLWAAASYFCLTLFDLLGTRYAGHRLPWRRVALAAFTALSLGHNIGFAGLSSGAIRYRIYSRWGLSAGDVGRVVMFSGLTVAGGLLALGSASFLLAPGLVEMMTGLPRGAIGMLGTAGILLILFYLGLAWWRPPPLRLWRWRIPMPPLRLAAGQILIGSVNFACVAACLHQALAAIADAPYLQVAASFAIAQIAAILSHVPGGLGVVENVILAFLPGAAVMGALVVYRVVYYFVPLLAGSVLFAAIEWRHSQRRRIRRQVRCG